MKQASVLPGTRLCLDFVLQKRGDRAEWISEIVNVKNEKVKIKIQGSYGNKLNKIVIYAM